MRGMGIALVAAALALLLSGQAIAKKGARVATVTTPVALAPGGQQIATAPCPKGTHVTGGGWADSSPYSANGTNFPAFGDDVGLRIIPLQSQPSGLNAWSAGAAAFTAPGSAGTLSAIARCESKSVSRTASSSPHTDVVQVDNAGTIKTVCPHGTHVLTGSFAFSPAGDLADPIAFRAKVAESRRISSSTWEVVVVNPAGAPAPVTLTTNAICERNSRGVNPTERSATVPIVDNSRASATASCTGKTHSVGGGFLVNPTAGPAVGVDQMQPAGAKAWQVGLYEYPNFTLPPGSTLTAYSYCRKNA